MAYINTFLFMDVQRSIASHTDLKDISNYCKHGKNKNYLIVFEVLLEMKLEGALWLLNADNEYPLRIWYKTGIIMPITSFIFLKSIS